METERIALSPSERDRLKVLHEVKEKHLTQVEGARRLKMTDRHVRRLLWGLQVRGDAALIHGLRGQPSPPPLPKVALSPLPLPPERHGLGPERPMFWPQVGPKFWPPPHHTIEDSPASPPSHRKSRKRLRGHNCHRHSVDSCPCSDSGRNPKSIKRTKTNIRIDDIEHCSTLKIGGNICAQGELNFQRDS